MNQTRLRDGFRVVPEIHLPGVGVKTSNLRQGCAVFQVELLNFGLCEALLSESEQRSNH